MAGNAPDHVLTAIAKLAGPESRREGARNLAQILGAEDLIIFVRDAEVARMLPAPGFPQTLPGARLWRELLDMATKDGSATREIPWPGADVRTVRAFASSETAAVAVLQPPDTLDVDAVVTLLPLLETAYRGESVARVAAAQALLARTTAAQATALAEKLDLARKGLRQALDIAEEATRARDLFLATISHELRTPLTSILGWLQLLRIQDRTEADLKDALDTIELNAKAQSRLIEDILDHSRITTGKFSLEVQSLDLNDPVREAFDIVRPAATAKQIVLRLNASERPVLVSGDADRLQQIAWNLLSNAVKFTRAGGSVEAAVEARNGEAEILVTDTGQGIEPAYLPLVFDRFSQGDGTSTRVHGGLGLGLSIVRLLVELHGGSVSVASDGPERGATFTVRLPLLEPARTDRDRVVARSS